MIQKKDYPNSTPRSDSQRPYKDSYRQRRDGDNARDSHGENQPFREKRSKQPVVCGLRPILNLIDTGKQIDRIYFQNGLDARENVLDTPLMGQLKAKIKELNIPFQYVPVEKLNKLTADNHQGVVATLAPIDYHSFLELLPTLQEECPAPFVLMLDHVTDVRELGEIASTAECAGVQSLVIPDRGSAQLNDDAVKSSNGALTRLPVCRESNLKTAINMAKQSDMQVIALANANANGSANGSANGDGSADYLDVDLTRPTLLIVGEEDTGVSPDLLRLCDKSVHMPAAAEGQSLHLTAAVAVLLFEQRRQRLERQ